MKVYEPRHVNSNNVAVSRLENSTRPLVFTSASGCMASENFDSYANNFCDAGQVPILRHFKV